MDIATLLGLIAGIIIIGLAVLTGSDTSIFINLPGILIVLGGSFSATLIKFPIKDCLYAFMLGVKKAFFDGIEKPVEIIKIAKRLAGRVRKESLLALEQEPVKNPFLRKGVEMCIDGHPPEFIREVLTQEMQLSLERHQISERIFRAIGESAPAFGMIGTLVGLVQMLSQLEDPSTIGPAMALALLTTLYGALFANLIALPIADKLGMRCDQEHINKSLIIESVLNVQRGENPHRMDTLLETFIPTHKRAKVMKKTNTAADKK